MIEETLKTEELKFRDLLTRGIGLLDAELARLDDGAALPGETAFKLYDTYGFPLDLTQDAMRRLGRDVDVAGFETAMAGQKAAAPPPGLVLAILLMKKYGLKSARKRGLLSFLGIKAQMLKVFCRPSCATVRGLIAQKRAMKLN